MFIERIPKEALEVMDRIRKAGAKAYLVGGCVRDLCMGKHPDDWDMTSSMFPEKILDLFGKNAIPTGIKHGTVTVKCGEFHFEITTHRRESGYSDRRRPDRVEFGASLENDLARRDFTINAMAWSPEDGIVDIFDGSGDIEKKIIRCVGDPKTRFSEDALRMFRAIRFSAKLGFTLDEGTRAAIVKSAELSDKIAAERIATEFMKTLISDRPNKVNDFFDFGLMKPFINGNHSRFSIPINVPNEYRIAFLTTCLDDPKRFASALKLSNRQRQILLAGADRNVDFSPAGIRKLIAEHGKEYAMVVGFLHCFDRVVARELESGHCLSIAELAISSEKLIEMGYSGTKLGEIRKKLFDRVLIVPEDNTPERLIALALCEP